MKIMEVHVKINRTSIIVLIVLFFFAFSIVSFVTAPFLIVPHFVKLIVALALAVWARIWLSKKFGRIP